MNNDPINPDYYTKLRQPPRDLIIHLQLGWDLGNVVKYVSRYKGKNGTQDIKKALRYMELYSSGPHIKPVGPGVMQFQREMVRKYCAVNQLDELQEQVLVNLVTLNDMYVSGIYVNTRTDLLTILERWEQDNGK